MLKVYLLSSIELSALLPIKGLLIKDFSRLIKGRGELLFLTEALLVAAIADKLLVEEMSDDVFLAGSAVIAVNTLQ